MNIGDGEADGSASGVRSPSEGGDAQEGIKVIDLRAPKPRPKRKSKIHIQGFPTPFGEFDIDLEW